MESFAKQQSSGSKENGMNRKSEIEKLRKNTDKKTVENSYESLRVVVSVCMYVGVCVCVYVLYLCTDACFYEVKPGYKRNVLSKRIWIPECILIFRDIILFLYA